MPCTGFDWWSSRAAQLHTRYMMPVPLHLGTGQLHTQSKLRLMYCHRTDQLGKTDTLSLLPSTHIQQCSPHTQLTSQHHGPSSSQHTAYTPQTAMEHTSLLRTAHTRYSDQSPGLPARPHSRYTPQHWHATTGLQRTTRRELRSHDQCQPAQQCTPHSSRCCQERICPTHKSCTWSKDQSPHRYCQGHTPHTQYCQMNCVLPLDIHHRL